MGFVFAAILGQNIVIVSLILALGTTSARTSGLPLLQILAFAAITLGGFYALYAVVPLSTLTTAFTLSIPLSLISKLPQIYANAKQGSTGQLSSFVVLASFMGTVARLYTSQALI